MSVRSRLVGASVASVAALSLAASCGPPPEPSSASPSSGLPRPPDAPLIATSAPRPAESADPAGPVSPPDAGAADAAAPSPSGACVEVSVSLDLRALPVHPSQFSIQAFGDTELSEFVSGAPPGPPPRVARHAGTAGFSVFFDAARLADAKVRCEAAVAAYVKRAPHLAGTVPLPSGKRGFMTAAQVTVPCRKCE